MLDVQEKSIKAYYKDHNYYAIDVKCIGCVKNYYLGYRRSGDNQDSFHLHAKNQSVLTRNVPKETAATYLSLRSILYLHLLFEVAN